METIWAEFKNDMKNDTYREYPTFYKGPRVQAVFYGLLMDVRQFKNHKITLLRYDHRDPYPEVSINEIYNILSKVPMDFNMEPWTRFLIINQALTA